MYATKKQINVRITNAYNFRVATHGCESFNISQAKNRAFGLICFTKVQRLTGPEDVQIIACCGT